VRRAWDSYRLLVQWQFLRLRNVLVLIALIQLALALGIVYGLSLLVPHLDHTSALFLATGAPTLSLLLLGLTVVPQEVSQAKLDGRFEYLSTFPVPRLTSLAADVSFWLVAQIPGTALALLVADLRFGLHLRAGWAVLPVFLLIALSSSAVGYCLAVLLRPQTAQPVTQFVALGILLFSPVNYPLERLPPVVRDVHRVLLWPTWPTWSAGASGHPITCRCRWPSWWWPAGAGPGWRPATGSPSASARSAPLSPGAEWPGRPCGGSGDGPSRRRPGRSASSARRSGEGGRR